MYTLAQALEMRGFLNKQEEDYIVFSHGNTPEERYQLEELLIDLNIPVQWEENKIYVQEQLIDPEQLEKIIWYPARNHEAGGGNGWYSWRYFSRREHGPKINTFVLETGVALLTKALSAAGFVTISSCDGHGKRAPLIAFSGKHNAAWFQVIFQQQFHDTEFNYKWDLKNTDMDTIDFTAKKIDVDWDHEKILEDTLQIARYFLQESSNLSETKRKLFRSNYKTRRKMVKEMTFEELFRWMEERYKSLEFDLNI